MFSGVQNSLDNDTTKLLLVIASSKSFPSSRVFFLGGGDMKKLLNLSARCPFHTLVYCPVPGSALWLCELCLRHKSLWVCVNEYKEGLIHSDSINIITYYIRKLSGSKGNISVLNLRCFFF